MIRQFTVQGGDANTPVAFNKQPGPYRLKAVSTTITTAAAGGATRAIALYVGFAGIVNVWTYSVTVADDQTNGAFVTFGSLLTPNATSVGANQSYVQGATPDFTITPQMQVNIAVVNPGDPTDVIGDVSFLIDDEPFPGEG